jgi:ABC-type spermidine/putrescine transport system permease subunit I
MIGLFIQSQFGHRLNAPLGAAMSFSVIAICLATITTVAWLLFRLTRPRG